MNIELLYCKIHRATVTEANLNYEGSISICPTLIDAAGLHINQKIDVLNCNNGARLTTYVIKGSQGQICLNGAAARHAQPGDLVILASYASMCLEEAKSHQPKLVFVDTENRIKTVKEAEQANTIS
ncbi:aspartate 1-decarboxylase [Marinicella gelatinilytica]|uniref:aspartate 1-decarboxylase n=1 Tax=Marinicella gelatinilytica TaxID=2996017 RepID=UPI0022608411|nr:aspartate 1-decarboxylase [Marinicella gelatinilytica]MCX7544032.1 aspartate 1-decarboxylase [Marinicella gelatinilytica]